MQNPFTTTFSKLPEFTYIETKQSDEILENFNYDVPTESVYKITGVRGSGKTVLLAKIEEELIQRDWIVIDVSPNRDILFQIASKLQSQGYKYDGAKDRNISFSFSILGTGGGFGYADNNKNVDIGTIIDKQLEKVKSQNRKVLIGIDEVSKNDNMISFSFEFGRWLRMGLPVYVVCTGLYENIEELSNVKNLTFFRRATTIKTEPLDFIKMSGVYKNKLNIEMEEAKQMAKLTKGYAYAFQLLGMLLFKEKGVTSEITDKLKYELFSYSYQKIWKELSENDRLLIKTIINKDEYKREEVLKLLGSKASIYSVYRDRLFKRGLINTRNSYISLALPFFSDYVKEYCM